MDILCVEVMGMAYGELVVIACVVPVVVIVAATAALFAVGFAREWRGCVSGDV